MQNANRTSLTFEFSLPSKPQSLTYDWNIWKSKNTILGSIALISKRMRLKQQWQTHNTVWQGSWEFYVQPLGNVAPHLFSAKTINTTYKRLVHATLPYPTCNFISPKSNKFKVHPMKQNTRHSSGSQRHKLLLKESCCNLLSKKLCKVRKLALGIFSSVIPNLAIYQYFTLTGSLVERLEIVARFRNCPNSWIACTYHEVCKRQRGILGIQKSITWKRKACAVLPDQNAIDTRTIP